MTYEEYKESQKVKKYVESNLECFVCGCHKKAEYEGGDARWYCGVCEEHAHLKEYYDTFITNKEPLIKPTKLNPNIDYESYHF